MKISKSKAKRQDLKTRMIKRQSDKIKSLEDTIDSLNIGQKEKDDIVSSVEDIIQELNSTIEGVKSKGKEYDRLMGELIEMRKVFNQDVFRGRWRLIKFILR